MVGNPIQSNPKMQFHISKKSHINVSLSQFQDKIPTYPSYLLKKSNVMIQRLIGVMGGHILFIVSLALVCKDIVYNSLRDFGP